MLRQKQAQNTHKIIKYGSYVNQNVAKQNIKAGNSYLLEKKGIKEKKSKYNIEADQVTPDSSCIKVKKVKVNKSK